MNAIRKGSTAWYKQMAKELKQKTHDIKYEFDPWYRFMHDTVHRYRSNLMAAFWNSGTNVVHKTRALGFSRHSFHDGFVKLIKDGNNNN